MGYQGERLGVRGSHLGQVVAAAVVLVDDIVFMAFADAS